MLKKNLLEKEAIDLTTRSTLPATGMVLAAMFAALTAVGAFIKVPVPVVPFTLQVLFVYFAGSLLGSRLGFISQLVYIAIGLAGVPVFTEGGGIGYILKPTFGYLIGFACAAYIIGRMIEAKPAPRLRDFMLAHFTGLALVYLAGTSYLYVAMNFISNTPFTLWQTFKYGFVLAVPGDIILCLFASVIAARVHRQLAPFRARMKGTMQA
ncbi:biotin transport system substrate-specific component [Aneurinibacillus soli]|uniref:Biotin transporter n=2 Tax=Aneurinibacillus soli TaxID=1500254 RepID=A0A0U5AYH2_9BACL|nr:biotin transport system substrate-specific component [Aneurinibacillus soli]BAU28821.1 Biotin transporter BioY [Aneurinibacillus soli]